MKKGDIISIQAMQATVRYVIRIDDWNHQCVYGTIIETVIMPESLWSLVTMYVAMPNKWDKAELIAQKLAELWTRNIVFWRAERSILREVNEKKVARIHKIIQEAVEQSWWWQLPNLSFQLEQNWIEDREVVLFDIVDDNKWYPTNHVLNNCSIGVIGPEWGLTEKDYKYFPHHIVSSLGNTILRMETAAIIWAYELSKK